MDKTSMKYLDNLGSTLLFLLKMHPLGQIKNQRSLMPISMGCRARCLQALKTNIIPG